MRSKALGQILLCFLTVGATAATHKTLYNFAGGTDGAIPNAPMVFDSKGNLYGVTNAGGNNGCDSALSTGCGTVFQLTLKGNSWKEKVLYTFNEDTDGGNSGAGIVMDASGNLYGTTLYYGGSHNGTVWELASAGTGKWEQHILHSFRGGKDGYSSYGISLDPQGRLFGTTFGGGANNDGVVFHLVPKNGNKWQDAILYAFGGNANDGNAPSDAPAFDASGNVYGTTYAGGPNLSGIVFQMQHAASGWNEAPIYDFQGQAFGGGSDGANPTAGVILDDKGNIFGTTFYGGQASVGVVYELSPDGKGGWKESVLYTFTDRKDGGHPAGLIRDAAGNLYGVTTGHNTFGSVFKLSPSAKGKWKFTVLYDFKGRADGGAPDGSLIMDAKGNLYGTASFGGKFGNGVVFEITP